jgi:hypothetical protein
MRSPNRQQSPKLPKWRATPVRLVGLTWATYPSARTALFSRNVDT